MIEKKILVVDDDGYQRRIIQRLLTKLGYSVATVNSAEEALALVQKEEFSVIITDLIMLNMDGLELCERLKEAHTDSVIFSLSGFQNLYSEKRLRRAGFDGHLEKPLDIDALEQMLEASFSRSTGG